MWPWSKIKYWKEGYFDAQEEIIELRETIARHSKTIADLNEEVALYEYYQEQIDDHEAQINRLLVRVADVETEGVRFPARLRALEHNVEALFNGLRLLAQHKPKKKLKK